MICGESLNVRKKVGPFRGSSSVHSIVSTVCAYPDPGCLPSVRNKPSQHTVADAHSDSLVGV